MMRPLRDYPYFFIAFGAWVVFGSSLIFITEKEGLHIWFNGHHHPLADTFFKYTTHLGDGIFGAFIVLLALIYKVRFGIIGLIGLAGSGIITQLLKRNVFQHIQRPSRALEQIADLHFIDGVHLHANFSFPSGHSTAAFATFLLLALIGKKPWIQMLCFILAVTIAFSRVYISQHFFEDILAGSIIGTGVTIMAYGWLGSKTWGEKGLVDLLKK